MELFGQFSEATVRFSAFVGIFLVLVVLEFLIPKRKLKHSKPRRWLTNLAIVGVDSVVIRLMGAFVVPLAAVSAGLWAESQGWGLFNLVDWPGWLEILLAVIVLDLAIFGQHVASHKWSPLWRLHKVHHTDVDIDVTTGIRFHPIEIALSMLWKIVVVIALGAAPVAIVLFEVILNGGSLFTHSNLALPRWLDRGLRLLFVTPDMHRIHHSIHRREHDSNFGFNLSVWDRLFSTYTLDPEDGHTAMTIGLPGYQSEEPTRFVWALALPFRGLARPTAEEDPETQKKLSGK